ncbi:aspartyl protease family protein [Algibacter miyuki]|uniref:Aspartyl protease family protein n=1 Tax=Algibacter miyuki TaxID=1306933 RepID=A0ABV5H3U4_9FLAO|nr:aspartyl protease family protein [Algibacter miyuki]MDN3665760.1 hypothetical protein [Algibacter miyuki]
MKDKGIYDLGITHKGKLTPNGMPYFKVNIVGGNLPKYNVYHNGIDAVLDTGATKTHITPQLAKELNLKATNVDYGLYPLKEGVSETNVFKIDFIINGIEACFSEEFKEMPYGFQFPLVFGTEFMIKCKKLSIDFQKEEYVLEL